MEFAVRSLRILKVFAGILLFGTVLFGQLDSNSVTVTANRAIPFQPDQVNILIQVFSSLNSSLDDVLAALQGSPISAANFSDVGGAFAFVGAPPPAPPVIWAFSLTVPFAKMKDTVALLDALRQNVPKKNSDLQFAFSVQGTSVSGQQIQAQTCPLADLMADARAQAQKIATAGGLTVGNILAILGSTVIGGPIVSSGSSVPGIPNCSITVKFALLRYQ